MFRHSMLGLKTGFSSIRNIFLYLSIGKFQSDNSDAFCSADEEFDECDGGEVKPAVVVLESVPSKEILELQVHKLQICYVK